MLKSVLDSLRNKSFDEEAYFQYYIKSSIIRPDGYEYKQLCMCAHVPQNYPFNFGLQVIRKHSDDAHIAVFGRESKNSSRCEHGGNVIGSY